MAQQFLLIDGYNLLHAAGLARSRYGPGDFERQRKQLIRFLTERLNAEERVRTTVVFDAALNTEQDAQREQVIDSLTILFTPTGVDADSLIEELIATHSSPKQLSVVSNDQRLITAATRRRAKPILSDDFFEQLCKREPLTPESPMEPTVTPPALTHSPTPRTAALPPNPEAPRRIAAVTDKDWDAHIDNLEADLKSRKQRHD